MIGVRSLVADLAAAGAPADVRLDALAGDFDVERGDPAGLRGRAPAWIADAAAVFAYEVREPAAPREVAPAPRPTRYLVGEPSAAQRVVVAALRRLIDLGRASSATVAAVLREARLSRGRWPDIVRGLEDRGLAEVLAGTPPIVVLGPRAHLYPDRIMPRTKRSLQIEAHLRAGLADADVRAAMTPAATRQEVVRVRLLHCADLPSGRALLPTGTTHATVVAAWKAGHRHVAALAARAEVTPERIRQILDNARRRGELVDEVAA